MPPDVSVVVLSCAGYPELGECLRGLARSHVPPAEVLVVDSSRRGKLAELVRAELPTVRVLRNAAGARARRRARQVGAAAATAEIVAFVDDDAVPDPRWIGTLREHYADPAVAGVGGRLLSRDFAQEVSGELTGRVLADGRLTANFREDPGRPVSVHHLSGVNMSFRRSEICDVDGREYPGAAEWEDADLCWQVRAGGGRLVFDPQAVVLYEPGRSRVGGRTRARPVRLHYTVRNNLALLFAHRAGGGLPGHFIRSTLRGQLDTMSIGGPLGSRSAAGAVIGVGARLPLTAGELTGLVLGLVDGVLRRAAQRRASAVDGRRL